MRHLTAVVAEKYGDDHLVDDRDSEAHQIAPEALGEAWAAHRKGRFGITTIEPPVVAPDLAAGIRAAIATTHAHLTGPVLGNSFDVNVGLSGARRFADLSGSATAEDDPQQERPTNRAAFLVLNYV